MSISVHPDTSEGRTLAASPAAAATPVQGAPGTKIRSRLFIKYVALFVAVVGVALLSNGIFEVFFYYREHKASLIRIQHEQAEAAAANKVYYGPVYFRRESEPYMTLSLAGTRKDAGVSIAEVNLKLIWDVVSQIKVGERGHAYVVGTQGRLIAHPDISLVLRNTDMSRLVQVHAAQTALAAVQAALAAQAEQAAQAAQAGQTGRAAPPAQVLPAPPAWTANSGPDALQGTLNIQGQQVLTASAPILPLGWIMFVELPVEEAYASLYAALQRLAIVLLGASMFAVLAGIFLARRMVGPIQALRAGAERIGGGDFAQRISIRTGDEL